MASAPVPPDIEGLQQRVRLFEAALAEEEREILRLLAPFVPGGLWVTADGQTWSFHRRAKRPRRLPAP